MAQTDYRLADAPRPTRRGSPTSASGGDIQIGNELGFSRINIPGKVAAGETFRVGGKIFLDALASITDVDTRVIVTALGQEKVVDTNKLGAGEGDAFSVEFDAPSTTGQEFTVEVDAQVNPPNYIPGIPSGWQTKTNRSKLVNSAPRSEVAADRLLDYAPYALAGGGLGYVASQGRGTDPQTTALVGAAAGAGAKWLGFTPGSVTGLVPGPLEVLPYVALLGTGIVAVSLLRTYTGGAVSDVTSAVGDRVGSTVSRGVKRAASDARSAVSTSG